MDPIDPFKPIVGDDAGYATPRLNQLPEGYGFSALTQHDDCPLTNAMWVKLIDFASRYYRHFEIVGRTYEDFQTNLQLSYDIGADTLERQLEVYGEDIAKPILGRTEKVTYNLQNTNSGGYDDTENIDVNDESTDNSTVTNNLITENEGQTDNIDVPIDASNPNTQTPSSIAKQTNSTSNTGTVGTQTTGNGTSTTVRTFNHKDDSETAQTGTVETELSDLGVRPNYESLNGFIDNNRTYYSVFVWLFRDCFAFNDVMTW